MLICKLIVTLIIYLEPNWFFFLEKTRQLAVEAGTFWNTAVPIKEAKDTAQRVARPHHGPPHPVSRLCPCLRSEGVGRGRPCLRAEGPGAEPGMAAGPDSLLRRPLHAIAIRLSSHHFLVHFGFWDFWKGIFHI